MIAVFLGRMIAAILLAAAMPATALAAWTEARSRHFIIYSQQSPAELKRYAEELERFDAAVRKVRGMKDPALTDAGKLTIYVLRSQAQVADVAGASGSGIAGFYIPRASGPLAFVHPDKADDEFSISGRTVFFHEYLHHLMLSESDLALPAWIVEGTAELFATARLLKDGSVAFGYPPQHRSYGLFNFSSLSTEEMVGSTQASYDGEQWEQIYGRGWLLTHYLTFGAVERKGQLSRYVLGIAQGKTALESARAAFGDLRQLDRDLSRHLNKSRLLGKIVPAAELPNAQVSIRPLGPGEDAMLPIRMRSERGVNERTAKFFAAEARKVAKAYPNDPEVLTSLAEAEQDVGDNAAAIAAADRALAAAPNNARAMIMKSRALLAMAEKDPAKTDWKALRGLIGRANRLDPDDAEPLMLFYRTFEAQKVAPTRNAVDGLLYAQALVPQDRELRVMAVWQMLNDNKLPAARRLLGPIAYDPHDRKGRENMIKAMELLGSGDGKGARDLLEKAEKKDDKDES